MLPSPRRLSRVVCLLSLAAFLLWAVTFSAGGEKVPSVKKKPGTDHYGDPLPYGAVSRLGTTRLRHTGEVGVLAFTPDGKQLGSAGADNTFRLWEVTTGKEIHR